LELLNGIVKRSTAYVSQKHFVSATGCFWKIAQRPFFVQFLL
jgi:hypothetical protein